VANLEEVISFINKQHRVKTGHIATKKEFIMFSSSANWTMFS